jgi:heme/copper-type cytochrome/quinol oxidase subunit 1
MSLAHDSRLTLRPADLSRWRATTFELPVPVDDRRVLALSWLWLGVAALALSGLFAALLVVARTPHVQHWLPVADFFRVALVVHVDLSVLVWFVACAGLLWTIANPPGLLWLNAVGLALASVGTACIVAAPFVDRAEPVMANYVPVLDGPAFLYGLALIGAGFACLVLRGLLVPPPLSRLPDGASSLRFGLFAAAVSAALALGALAASWYDLPASIDARAYYETLFWGAGHVAQFTWTLLMLVAWLWLAHLVGARLPLSPRVAGILFGLGLSAALVAPLIYLRWTAVSVEHHRMFTWLMRFGGGLAILPLALAVAVGLAGAPPASPSQRPLRSALLASMLLFGVGGVVGFLIRGSDVRIPAHYHGSIVGVTLALMGAAYALAPRLGGRHVSSRLATWQVRCYAGGQLMHVAGLLWSGGYGVQRKVAGAEQVLTTPSQVAGMGLMGAGGLVAIVGGLLFVVTMWRALRGTPLRTGPDR